MITKSDFDKICRTCLEIKFDKMNQFTLEIKNMLQTCTTIQLNDNERLPNQICDDCVNKTNKYYEFKKQCEHSEQYLIELLNEIDDNKTWFEHSDIKFENTANDSKVKIIEDSNDYKSDLIYDNNDDLEQKGDDSKQSSCDENFYENEDNENDEHKDVKLIETYDKNKLSKRKSQINWVMTLDPDKCDTKQLLCKICDKTLVHIGSLARHMETHEKNRSYSDVCKLCDKGFYEEANYLKHMERHKNDAKYNCDKCRKKFYELNSLSTHLRKIHKAKPINCTKCDKEFIIQKQLDIHLKKHSNDFEHKCSQCGKGYFLIRRLEKHLLTHKKTFYCDICDKTYANHTSLKNHTDRYHISAQQKQECQICGKIVLHMKRHMLVHNAARSFECIDCKKSFLYRSDLVAHCKRKHDTTNKDNLPQILPYLCNICGKGRASQSALNMHIIQAHTTEKTKKCHLCDKIYKTGSALHRHIRFTHKDERRFKCTVCTKVFYTNPILRIHMRTHTGERPYQCLICKKAFVQSSTLKTHMKVHTNADQDQ